MFTTTLDFRYCRDILVEIVVLYFVMTSNVITCKELLQICEIFEFKVNVYIIVINYKIKMNYTKMLTIRNVLHLHKFALMTRIFLIFRFMVY